MLKGWTWCWGFAFLAVVLSNAPVSWGATGREAQLEQTVEMLLKRVEALESKIDSMAGTASTTSDLEERLARVEASKSSGDFKVFWNKGINFQTEDKAFSLKLGGRAQTDWYWGSYDDGDFENGVRFRRARLSLGGTIYEDIDFKWEYDFAEKGDAKWRDVFMAYHGIDFVTIKIGQFHEPIGLEEITSDNDISMIERSPAITAFVPSRQTGIMLYNYDLLDKRLGLAAGYFYTVNDYGDGDENDAKNGDYDLSARIYGLPWFEDEGAKLLHLGAAYSHREWDGDDAQFRSRGSWSKGDYLVDTDKFAAEDSDLFGAEAAVVFGPASLQGEYLLNSVDGAEDVDDADFQGFYVQAGYFLTGEHRGYSGGIFKAPSIKENFSLKEGGAGAWEVTARYSYLDLDDGDVQGGQLDDVAVGLNWYLNPNTKVMANYAHAEEDGDGAGDEGDVFTMRFQLAF